MSLDTSQYSGMCGETMVFLNKCHFQQCLMNGMNFKIGKTQTFPNDHS